MAGRKSGFLTGLFIGGLIGTVMGVLYAPRSGEKTREKLTERGEEVANDLRRVASTVARSGENIIDNLKSIALDATGLLSDTLRVLRREIREETEELREMVRREREGRSAGRSDESRVGRSDEEDEDERGASRKHGGEVVEDEAVVVEGETEPDEEGGWAGDLNGEDEV
ncbi:MAG TPA: YtxH domain-containing protein [Clostridia bacterium]|nr:YtxH domain-containing protein [Clostridia bacterium]